MTIPDSRQTLGKEVSINCWNLVPSSIDVSYRGVCYDGWSDDDGDADEDTDDTTLKVVAHLRAQQNNVGGGGGSGPKRKKKENSDVSKPVTKDVYLCRG